MSLINEMLRDLDRRKQQEKQAQTPHQDPVTVSEKLFSLKPRLVCSGALFLGVLIWIAVTSLSAIVPRAPVSQQELIPSPVVPAVISEKRTVPSTLEAEIDQQQLLATTIAVDNGSGIVVDPETELLGLDVVEADGAVQLNLYFGKLPEYRLLQNGLGVAQLVLSFNNLQIGADFEIPPLTGTILQRISLLPQKEVWQLLVDLNSGAQVQSVQLVNDLTQGYLLLIDIIGPREIAEKPQIQTPAPPVEPAVESVPNHSTLAAKSKVSKNKNILSPDQQAYTLGLEKLGNQEWTSAVGYFNQALSLNPALLDARLRLVGVLQQRQQLDEAEEVLQQGLQLTPENPALRKLYARLLMNGQRYSEAITLLQSKPAPLIDQDLEYHALLAALLQETKQFFAARQLYRQLLQVRPQAALWWMGLAISEEQLGQMTQARSAYQRALSLPGLRPELENYIQSRLQAL
ncbi:Tetratricopeptide repeat-containing protein [Desulfuromusa kysingii]|uniref:Tetratricopeptide repeat-containing protein n=1 Tax=Desulfuromusa kysingii TaxID=37625 RepID=A0A1H3WT06_9BACT|nr:tetratricopeptide repeat protein [Desulfuromusa kysingii]SDZ90285.1 Tetratricopeptide repeat-containing protein [Desulfuromusa kysingii]